MFRVVMIVREENLVELGIGVVGSLYLVESC